MIKIESTTLEGAYADAASSLECSVTQLKIEVVQYPSSGFLGLFKKSAIIVAVKEMSSDDSNKEEKAKEPSKPVEFPEKKEKVQEQSKKTKSQKSKKQEKPAVKTDIKEEVKKEDKHSHTILNDTIMPQSFVSTQEDEDEEDDIAS
ncbi:MAG: Jag N-terminal domain-containing protein, partial [Campylobacterota bacterium]|nr:Jag N-terminal domain-containing protein [Campylobacterota bacterium]